jgi:hypothetical protein
LFFSFFSRFRANPFYQQILSADMFESMFFIETNGLPGARGFHMNFGHISVDRVIYARIQQSAADALALEFFINAQKIYFHYLPTFKETRNRALAFILAGKSVYYDPARQIFMGVINLLHQEIIFLIKSFEQANLFHNQTPLAYVLKGSIDKNASLYLLYFPAGAAFRRPRAREPRPCKSAINTFLSIELFNM